MSRCLRLPETKWIGEGVRDAPSIVKVLRGLGRTKGRAIGRRRCGSNNSKGMELMEPAIDARLMPFPLLRIGNGPRPRLTLRRSFFPALGRASKSGVLTCTFTTMAEHPDTITITWQPPPDELFDAQIDVAATLATNSALLRNAPLARHFTRRWLQYAGTRMRAGNRIAIGHVARFIEAELDDVDVLDGEGVEPFPDVQLPSYADDTHIVGAPARAAEAFAHLQGGLATLSLRFRRPAHGIVALGVPIGSVAHIHEVVGAKLQFFSEQLTTLPMLRDLQIAYALLVRVFVLRPSYLMRTVAPSPEFLEQLRGYDRLLLGCFESLLGPDAFAGEAGELARRQVTLPTSFGGLGVRSTAATAPAAFLGAWALVGSLIAGRFVRSGEQFLSEAVSDGVETGGLPFQLALRAAPDSLPGEAAGQALGALARFGREAERGEQERLTAAIELGAVQGLRDQTGDPAQRARLVSKTGPGAAAWLSTAPLFQALTIEDECFRTALRSWLGLWHLMVVGIALCECGQSLQGPLGGQHLRRMRSALRI
ncbi:hypothetical protein KFL_008770060 [Klebsormidium nitens]|uniref:Uncharacterized protein n=1 Tax=Klebsormidium nitens TaxID=105231 RepID=A0A1Y1ILY4_KLENI|nr:hypothetical protein KFL_008770060 [Klebsormidium nitens]|eukprot:GAQ91895.1 hypothetical protein KFL_008770060 [Klebsormidium nitens]